MKITMTPQNGYQCVPMIKVSELCDEFIRAVLHSDSGSSKRLWIRASDSVACTHHVAHFTNPKLRYSHQISI